MQKDYEVVFDALCNGEWYYGYYEIVYKTLWGNLDSYEIKADSYESAYERASRECGYNLWSVFTISEGDLPFFD